MSHLLSDASLASYGDAATPGRAWLPKLLVRSDSVVLMSERAENMSNLLMLRGVTATCADCGDERLFVPADADAPLGEYCCTTCDAAVFLLVAIDPTGRGAARRVA
jgi:hypothetical protein